MQCRVCGRAVADGDRFCTACGTSLVDDPAVASDDDAPVGSPTADPTADAAAPDFVAADPSHDPAVSPGAATAETDTADHISDDESTTQMPIVATADVDVDTEQITALVDAPGDAGWDDPVWAATGPVDQVPVTSVSTPPIVEAYPDSDPPQGSVPWESSTAASAAPTGVVAAQTTAHVPVVPTAIPERRGFRFSAVTLLAAIGSVVTMISMFATIVTVSSDQRIVGNDNTPANFRLGSWIPSDLADNLPIAGLIAVAALLCGGIAAGFGSRGGSGLAAGSGLAIAGLAALTIGLAQIPIDAAYEMAQIPTDERFTLTITRDLGYWLQLAAGAIGVVVFFASLNDAVGDGRRGLNPWIAALGALAGVVMAAGPLIPEGLAVFSDNWYVTEGPGQPPAMLLSMRLVQLALLALTSLIGFLSVRRWGLGVAVGGALPSLWLTISTLFELTDHPIGPGFRNPGATEMSVHGVTIIGASALLAFLILALVAAYDQAQHEW